MGVPRTPEAPHPSLARARPLTVRVFRAVVQSFVSPVRHARQHLPQRRPIAGEFVRDHHP